MTRVGRVGRVPICKAAAFMCTIHFFDFAVWMETEGAMRQLVFAWANVTRVLISKRTPSLAASVLEIVRANIPEHPTPPPSLVSATDSSPVVSRSPSEGSLNEDEADIDPATVFICIDLRMVMSPWS